MNENTVSISHTRSERWAKFLFWSWNIIFLTFMILGFAPRILPEMVTAVRLDTINLIFLIYALVLACIPLAAVLLGLTMLRDQPGKLFALGYVVEGPLMLMLAVRFFAVRQAFAALTCLIIVTCLGLAVFLWDLLDRRIEQRGVWARWLRLFGLTLMLLVSLYAALWIAFYALPLGWAGLKWLLDTVMHLRTFFTNLFGVSIFGIRELLWLPFTLLGTVLGLYTATLFVLAPVAVPVLSYRAWKRACARSSEHSGKLVPALVSCTDCCCKHWVVRGGKPAAAAARLRPAGKAASKPGAGAAAHRPGREAAQGAAEFVPGAVPLYQLGRRGAPHLRFLHELIQSPAGSGLPGRADV